MKIACTKRFKRDFQKLPHQIRKAAAKQITQLLLDHTHPSLHLEAIVGHKGLLSARVDRRYRISLIHLQEEETLVLRRVLDHDDLYRSP